MKKVLTIMLGLVAAIMSFIGKDTKIFGGNYEIHELLKAASLFSGMAISSLILPLRINSAETKSRNTQEKLIYLVEYIKELSFAEIRSIAGIPDMKLHTRFFVPKHTPMYLRWMAKKHKVFILKEIPGLTDETGTQNLQFEVWPLKQGLIGETYDKQASMADLDVKGNGIEYNLTPVQKMFTNDVEMCVTFPLFGENGKIIAVIGIDGTCKLNLSKKAQEAFLTRIRHYCLFINRHLVQ